MRQLALAGHPVHPQLIPFPRGLLPFSSILDMMHLATGKQSYADAAYYTLVGGYVGAVVAGATGAADFLTIESGTKPKQAGNTHAILNGTAMALETANLVMRRRRSPGALPAVLGLISTGILLVSQWYDGGELSYKYGMRVQHAVGDNKRPGRADRAVERAFVRAEQTVPATGPQL